MGFSDPPSPPICSVLEVIKIYHFLPHSLFGDYVIHGCSLIRDFTCTYLFLKQEFENFTCTRLIHEALFKRILKKASISQNSSDKKTFHLHCTNLDDSVNLYHTEVQYINETWVNRRQYKAIPWNTVLKLAVKKPHEFISRNLNESSKSFWPCCAK